MFFLLIIIIVIVITIIITVNVPFGNIPLNTGFNAT